MKDIKQFYLGEIARNPRCFAFEENFPSNEEYAFSENLQIILNSTLEKHTKESVNRIIKIAMTSHGKDHVFGPATHLIRAVELRLRLPNQRLHYLHLPNVFMLGLLLYEKCFKIRQNINTEIMRTSKSIPECGSETGNPFLSAGNLRGEFLYRWRLASLCHDLGYIVTLEEGPDPQTGIEKLRDKGLLSNDEITHVKDFHDYGKRNLLNIINSKLKRLNLNKYKDRFYDIHYENRYYEHGLFSALLFLRFMHEHFDMHRVGDSIIDTNGNATCIHKTLLQTSLLQVAKAIALHNIEKSEASLDASTNGRNFKMDAEKDALSCLLKVCDMLQEWDKPAANSQGNLSVNAYPIEIKDDHIRVAGFPGNQEQILKAMEFMHGLENFVRFE